MTYRLRSRYPTVIIHEKTKKKLMDEKIHLCKLEKEEKKKGLKKLTQWLKRLHTAIKINEELVLEDNGEKKFLGEKSNDESWIKKKRRQL